MLSSSSHHPAPIASTCSQPGLNFIHPTRRSQHFPPQIRQQQKGNTESIKWTALPVETYVTEKGYVIIQWFDFMVRDHDYWDR